MCLCDKKNEMFSRNLSVNILPNHKYGTIMLIDEIRERANNIYDTVLKYRRHLHAHPELSFHEYETSAFVKSCLDELVIEWKEIAGTGITALIKGDRSSDKMIALRADMDALPIKEANQVEYASKNDSVMHACGHDAHTASLLGTAHLTIAQAQIWRNC